MRRRLTRDRSAERGSIAPLIIGFGVSLILLTVVVFDASQVWIYQRGLHSIADGASLEAANALDAESVYGGGGIGDSLELDEAEANARVDAYTANMDVSCDAAVSGDGHQVTVACDGVATLPILSSWLGAMGEVGVESQATAETFTSD
jgi:Putative Flp pilus-assembly TadE/G-like